MFVSLWVTFDFSHSLMPMWGQLSRLEIYASQVHTHLYVPPPLFRFRTHISHPGLAQQCSDISLTQSHQPLLSSSTMLQEGLLWKIHMTNHLGANNCTLTLVATPQHNTHVLLIPPQVQNKAIANWVLFPASRQAGTVWRLVGTSSRRCNSFFRFFNSESQFNSSPFQKMVFIYNIKKVLFSEIHHGTRIVKNDGYQLWNMQQKRKSSRWKKIRRYSYTWRSLCARSPLTEDRCFITITVCHCS